MKVAENVGLECTQMTAEMVAGARGLSLYGDVALSPRPASTSLTVTFITRELGGLLQVILRNVVRAECKG